MTNSNNLSGPKRILSIDDDPSFNLLLKKFFSKLPYKLTTTETVADFLKNFKQLPPSLCLVDINLNEKLGAGLRLLELIRSQMDKNIPIIIISKMSSNQSISYALELGASDFLSKPLDEFSLEKKLKLFLETSDDGKRDHPLFKISEFHSECEFSIDITLKEIDEFSFILQSPHHITAGTRLLLRGDLIREITQKEELKVYVQKSLKSLDGELFDIEVEFSSEDPTLKTSIRRWLNLKKAQSSVKTILIVDDDPSYRSLLKKEIKKIPGTFEILEESSGNAAGQLLKTEKIDFILSDYDMDNGSGIDLLKMIRREKLSIPFLLMSTKEQNEITRQTKITLTPPETFLKKPLTAAQLTPYLVPGAQWFSSVSKK